MPVCLSRVMVYNHASSARRTPMHLQQHVRHRIKAACVFEQSNGIQIQPCLLGTAHTNASSATRQTPHQGGRQLCCNSSNSYCQLWCNGSSDSTIPNSPTIQAIANGRRQGFRICLLSSLICFMNHVGRCWFVQFFIWLCSVRTQRKNVIGIYILLSATMYRTPWLVGRIPKMKEEYIYTGFLLYTQAKVELFLFHLSFLTVLHIFWF